MADNTVQQIKDRLSIVDVVGGYLKLQKAGRNMRACCPFHKERTPSFMVSPERGTYMCFGCGEKGDIFSFVEKMESISFKEALAQLADRAGVKIVHTARAPEHKEKDERLYEVCEEATRFFEGELKKRNDVGKYLVSRGLKNETIALWRLGYAPASWEDLSKHLEQKGFSKDDIVDAGLAARSEKKKGEIYDRFRGRIMFPIFNTAGRVIAFSGRFFEDIPRKAKTSGFAGSSPDASQNEASRGEPAKYVNSPETALFKKSRALYGFDRAKESMRKMDCILLVEGQFDVVLSHQAGLRFAVALSGTALTPEHLSLLSRMSRRLVLALDADEAGIRSGLKSAVMALTAGFDVKIPKLAGGKDPADLVLKDPELLKKAVRESVPAVEFFLEALRPAARDERGYKKIVETQVLPLVAALQSKIDQAHFVRIVAQRLRVPEDAVRAEVGKQRPRQYAGIGGVVSQNEPKTGASAEPELTPLEKNAGMLIFHFGKDSPVAKRLEELLGTERYAEFSERLVPRAEWLTFKFDTEVGEHADEAAVAGDMLKHIEFITLEEQISAAGTDTKKVRELARRKDELMNMQ